MPLKLKVTIACYLIIVYSLLKRLSTIFQKATELYFEISALEFCSKSRYLEWSGKLKQQSFRILPTYFQSAFNKCTLSLSV